MSLLYLLWSKVLTKVMRVVHVRKAQYRGEAQQSRNMIAIGTALLRIMMNK
ncbi:hypothetical protein NECAME_12537 [Necator americanus]|uniref:Uncharacterized protein n=1 Tax=Necator americanus TaxID=51031 RepID=W2T243_NECAM|nr:hypothetical protein NECAME_12537 [Necator americanus]ETN75052.1 hypothetical protein NECAME_12537 [Necator americanus]